MDSPETMPEVKGLTDDHLIEVSAGVFMKFKHSYVVGSANAQEVLLLDPHGDIDSDGKNDTLYSPDLVTIVNDFYTYLTTLEKELKASEYSSFSVVIRDKMHTSMTLLDKQKDKVPRTTKPILEELRKSGEGLNNKEKLVKETDC